jgi:ATP/maltotriose-dependent transcriptional regulator MalT
MAEAGDALTDAGRFVEAAGIWRSWLDRLPEGSEEMRKALVMRLAMNAMSLAETPPEFSAYLDELLAKDQREDTHGDRLIASAAAAGLVFGSAGSAHTARELAVRAWGGGKLLEEETAAGAPLYVVSGALSWTDTYDVALELLDRAVSEARSTGSTLALATALHCRGYSRMQQGSIAAALDDFNLVKELRRFGWDAYVPPLLQCLVEIHLLRGHGEAAREHGAELSTYLGEHTNVAAYSHAGLADLAVLDGDLERAADLLESLGALLEISDNPVLLSWRTRLARVRARQGDHASARALASEELEMLRAWGAPRATAHAAVVRAELGEVDAEELLREALDLTEPDHLRLTRERAHAASRLAARLLDSDPVGGRAEAAELAKFAYGRAIAEGLAPLADSCAALLVRCGVAADPDNDPLADLSPAERRVVELVLSGMTNREVAGELFVTVKAVEFQLSSVYRKLGIRSRRDLLRVMSGR